jgi:hypothetical protein
MDSLRSEYVKPQLHLLAPLAETPIYSQFRDRLLLDDILSDISCEGWRQNEADRRMIQSHPEIFPNFYEVPTRWLERGFLKELRDFILHGLVQFRWLLVALHQASGDLLEVFDVWRVWRSEEGSVVGGSVPYYARVEFVHDFLNFARWWCAKRVAHANLALSTLLECMTALHGADDCDFVPLEPSNDRALVDPDAIPHLASGVRLARLGADYKAVIQCLKRKGRLDRIPARPLVIAARKSSEKRAELLQLTPSSALLLQMCDGRRTTRQITERFISLARKSNQWKGIPAQKVCATGLDLLREQHLIAT